MEETERGEGTYRDMPMIDLLRVDDRVDGREVVRVHRRDAHHRRAHARVQAQLRRERQREAVVRPAEEGEEDVVLRVERGG